MRWVGVGVVAGLLAFRGGTAAAQVADSATRAEFPLELADRPLVMFAGMTRIGLDVAVPTVIRTMEGSMGNTTARRSRLLIPSVGATHSFGAFEVFAETDLAPGGDLYVVGGELNLGRLPGTLSVALAYGTEDDLLFDVDDEQGHGFEQRVRYAYKAFLAPARFALTAAAGVAAAQLSRTPPMGMAISESLISTFAAIGPQLQITRRLAAHGRVSLNVPVHGDRATTLFTYVGLLAARRHWDFYGGFGMADVTGTRLPVVTLGVVYRFGQLSLKGGPR